ncbi:uncharacterized protein LOC102709809 [Oryza brachyantha]|uniref:SPRY domain-containing protein n=1 Tax=Oryza brachyantha TaxID=4533 RepID=J3LER5_ORYBR|nr:uncharacterized protein LOC102709809 [Oryza brachyantha]
MALWLKLLLSVLLPIAALLAVAFFVYRRRGSPRNAPPELPETVGGGGGVVGVGGGGDTAASPGLGKLNIRYNATSGRAGLRFQQLHHHHHHHHAHVDGRHHRGGGAQQGSFQWADHPRLVTEAAENGWAQFVFAVAPPRTRSASSSPLWGLCPACDSGTSIDMADAAWEVPAGSSERMQAVRLNPVTAAAVSASSTKKWLPGSIPSPLRGGDQDAGNSNALCLARMSLPLPGPLLAGAPFPQDAYFEITIIYLNTRRPEWSASRASRRGRDGSSESDRVKLISFVPDAKNAAQETRAATKADDHQDKQRHTVMSMGLAAASAPSRPSLAGTYASSIGFHSNGAVYLDGMKLVYESEKSSWAGVDKVVGCGFEPAKRKVFFTVDGQLVHAVSCNADAFSSPMYPVLASSFDVMALVNLGQGKFRYAPANARRTANPCFLRDATSAGDDAPPSGGSIGLDFDDSGDLFSMGRVDSGWLETASRISKSRKDNGGGGLSSASAGDPDADSDLFEISLRD